MNCRCASSPPARERPGAILFTVLDSLARPHGEPLALDAPRVHWAALAADPAGAAFLAPVEGTIYGVLLNHAETLAGLGDRVSASPYQAPPRAPVLYIKPRNTVVGHRQPVMVPDDASELEVGATLGAVIGSTACRVSEAHAMSYVAGYTVVNDLRIPHASYYRPSLRFNCRDGFCPIGPAVVARRFVPDPDSLAVTVAVDGTVVQRTATDRRIRPMAQLLADVTEFMTLHPGDVLTLGVAAGAPRACAGQRVEISIEGVGRLETPLVAVRR